MENGNSDPTLASFNGTHTYESPGVQTVTVTVEDDDGGSDTATFQITVNSPPALSITASQSVVSEAGGSLRCPADHSAKCPGASSGSGHHALIKRSL